MILGTKNRSAVGRGHASIHSSSLSSLIFCTKKCPVVKTTGCEKVRNLSEAVELIYVNPICINCFHPPVENPCGKGCGECGKVRVFNSYFASLENPGSMWKTLHNRMHKHRALRDRFMLRHRMQEDPSSRKSSKLLKPAVNLTVKNRRPHFRKKYFCQL